MKRWIAFAIVVTLGIAALVWSECRPVEVQVSPAALLYFIADTERELSRLPVSVTRLSDQEEIDIGNRLARLYSLDSSRNLPPEQARQAQVVADYVSRVGGSVAARAHRKLPYKFHYVRDMDFVNAFALPGGHVYIGAGLVALMDTEDELAAVLGHEIEHIDHYHCAERVQLEARLRKVPLGELLEPPVEIFEAGYNKDQELEADREGTRLALWASYSPLGALRMFETYDRLYQEYVRRARSPQEELGMLAAQTIEGYFRSHPPPSERIEQIRKLIADEHWQDLTRERDLQVAYVFWTERAWRAYSAHHYEVAAGFAKRSLQLEPNQPSASVVLGRAEFAQANFPEAAAAFRKALDKLSVDEDLLEDYSDALAARRTPAASLEEFKALLVKHGELKQRPFANVDLAGLALAARGEAAARATLTASGGQTLNLPPELAGRYGWWYYRVGRYNRAAELLESAVQERPADHTLQMHLGWTLVEQQKLEGAFWRFNNAADRAGVSSNHAPSTYRRSSHESRMGLAVAHWQSHQFDIALREFTSTVQPEWLNPKWVEAVYSARVAKTIEELKAEQKKRRTGQGRLSSNGPRY
jgi:predicted Zn-dependent protease